MIVRPFLQSIPQIAWALPRHWTWTPRYLTDQIVSRAEGCRASPVLKVDGGSDVEERQQLRRWRRIAGYRLDIIPEDGDAWIVLGHAECRTASLHRNFFAPRARRRFEAAKRAYRVAAKLKNDCSTWNMLGELGVYSGDLELQFSAFRTALEIDPTNAWSQRSLGEAHAKANQHHEAVSLFKRSLEHMREQPFAGVVYVELALSELGLGNVEDAINSLLKAVNSDEGSYFGDHYPDIAVGFYGHDKAAAELRDRLSAIKPDLAEKFYTFFQPRVGTVMHAKDYYRIKTDSGRISYGDYFITAEKVAAAGITKLRVGDQIAFHVEGREVLVKHLKLLPQSE